MTVHVEECRLETFVQSGSDAGDGGSDLSQSDRQEERVASHRSSWISLFKVNSEPVRFVIATGTEV